MSEDRMNSVSVDLHRGVYYVVVIHGSDGGQPVLAAGPVFTQEASVAPAELGALVRSSLAKTRHDHPWPETREQMAKILAPVEAALGKKWSVFAKQAASMRIDQTGDRFVLLPCIYVARRGFAPVMERQRELVAPTDGELGGWVVEELEFARVRDGLP